MLKINKEWNIKKVYRHQFSLTGIKVFSLFFSVAFFSVACFLYLEVKDFVNNSYRSKGIVVHIDEVESTDDEGRTSTWYASKIAYKMHNKHIGFFLSDYRHNVRYDINDEVELRYSTTNYKDVRINKFGKLWGGVAVFGSFGITFLLLGLYLIIFKPKLVTREVAFDDD